MASYKPNYKKPNINTQAVQKSVSKATTDIVNRDGLKSYTKPQTTTPQQGTAKPQTGVGASGTQQGYQSGYQKQLDDAMDKILNREDFAYDLNGDALWKQYQSLFWGALKSLQMVIAAMKLKDTYSLEGKL